MPSASALDLRVEMSLEFVRRHFGRRGRVLDVGCGEGRLVERLAAIGNEATGIDTSDEAVDVARRAGRKVRQQNFLGMQPAKFDLIFFGGSLHHMHPLGDTIERAAAMLDTRGLLLADEFDLAAVDEPTANWFFHLMDLLDVFEPAEASPDEDPVGDALHRWRAKHRHDPPLARGAEMTAALATHFEVTHRESCAYLYWYALRRLDSRPRGREIAQRLVGLEQRLIAEKRIRPVGLRIVACPRAPKHAIIDGSCE